MKALPDRVTSNGATNFTQRSTFPNRPDERVQNGLLKDNKNGVSRRGRVTTIVFQLARIWALTRPADSAAPLCGWENRSEFTYLLAETKKSLFSNLPVTNAAVVGTDGKQRILNPNRGSGRELSEFFRWIVEL